MNYKTESRIQMVCPDQARKWLEENNFHLQRKLKPSNIKSLVLVMEEDDFQRGTTLVFSILDGKLTLMDGQHRLKAQTMTRKSIEYCLVTLECSTAEEVHALYTQIDIGNKRSMRDRMKALDLKRHIALTSKQSELLSMGTPYIKYRFGRISPAQVAQITPIQRLELCKDYEEGAALFFKCIESGDTWIKKTFLKPHFTALASYLFQHSPEHSKHLWESLVNNECGSRESPLNYILQLTRKVQTNATGFQSNTLVLQSFIQGWNAIVMKSKVEKSNSSIVPLSKVKILGLDENMEDEINQQKVNDSIDVNNNYDTNGFHNFPKKPSHPDFFRI